MSKSVLQQLKENEREMRRKLIIDAAKNLFNTTSFHSIGMRTIANEAGISVASLYQYFPCQDDLFVEILKTDLQTVKNQLWTKKTSLGEISIDIVDFFLDNEDIFQMMSHFMLRGEKNREALEKFNKIQAIFLDLLNETLAKTNMVLNDTSYSKAFFTALFGNIITFRNTNFSEENELKNNLYEIVRITARAFQDLFDLDNQLKNTA